MSKLVKEIEGNLNSTKMEIEQLLDCESRLTEEYNEITQEYRTLFNKLKEEIKHRNREIIENCDHTYVRYSEYHNDRYFVCEKCNHEKY